jgi:hypothetical protein
MVAVCRKRGSRNARRSKDSLEEVCTEWDRAPLELIGNAVPWRTFRWHHGQKHYSGTYWSATEQAHVIYESRLELARLLFADFDTAVDRIVAQPCLFRAVIDKRERKHVPDYLLLTSGGPVVVDVKPRSQLDKPKVKFTLDWTRLLVEGRGWRYEVWSEPPATELGTIRFLAGFRNAERFDPHLVNALKARDDLEGQTLEYACATYRTWTEPVVRSTVLHLLWCNHFAVNLDEPLSPGTILTKGAPHE